MAITKNLIHFNEKTKFEEKLANNEILDKSIVFIKDTQEIYTHGQLYKCADPDLSIYLTTTNAGNTYATITTANGLQENIDDVITDLQDYKTTVANTYITPSEVDTKIAALVDSAPTTLDTLNELAAALGDDPNFATTVATNIGKKADQSALDNYLPLTGGRLKGELKINTEAENDNQKFGFFKTDNSNQNNYGCLQIGTNVGTEKPIGLTLSGCDPTLTANGTDKYALCVVGLGKGYTTQELKDLTRNSDKTERCRVVVNGNLLMENGKIIGTADAADSVPWTGVIGRPASLPASDVYAWAKKSSLALEDVPDLSSKYLPLSGGTIEGVAAFSFGINYLGSSSYTAIPFYKNGTIWGALGMRNDEPIFINAANDTIRTLIHSGNYSDYALPLSGGTMTGALTLSKEGSDIFVINRLNSSSPTTITYRKDGSLIGRMGFNVDKVPVVQVESTYQTLIHSGNIGSQSVASATSATKLDDNTAFMAWGQPFFQNGKPRDVDGSLVITNGTLTLTKGQMFQFHNATDNTFIEAISFRGDSFHIGYGNSGLYATYVQGNSIVFRPGASRVEAMQINSSGNVTIGGSDTAGTDYKLRVDGLSRFTDRVSVTSLRIVPVNGSFAADLAMDGSSLTLNRELKFTNVTASDICSGIAAAFKTSLAQAENLIARNIILGASSGSASNLALNFQKYTSISNTAPNGLTTLMTLTNDGNLGIGTTDPAYKLDVVGSARLSAGNSLYIGDARVVLRQSDGVTYFGTGDLAGNTVYISGKDVYFRYNGTSVGLAMRSSGNVLIGQSGDDGYKLDVGGTGRFTGALTVGAGATITGAVTIDGETAATQTWVTSQGYKTTDTNTTYTFAGGTNEFTVTPSNGSAQTVTITPSITGITAGTGLTGGGTSGTVTLGLTNTYQTYISNGNTAYSWGNHSGKYLPIEGGTCTGAITATAFYQSSDETLKVFGDDISIDFNALKRIPKKYFNWKDGNGTIEIGTGAQSLQKVYPELVAESNGHLVVAYDKLSIIALKAIDVLHAENQELKNRLTKLEEMVYGNRY